MCVARPRLPRNPRPVACRGRSLLPYAVTSPSPTLSGRGHSPSQLQINPVRTEWQLPYPAYCTRSPSIQRMQPLPARPRRKRMQRRTCSFSSPGRIRLIFAVSGVEQFFSKCNSSQWRCMVWSRNVEMTSSHRSLEGDIIPRASGLMHHALITSGDPMCTPSL